MLVVHSLSAWGLSHCGGGELEALLPPQHAHLWPVRIPEMHVLGSGAEGVGVVHLRSNPEFWEDPKNGCTLRLYHLHHRNIRLQNWKFCFLDPPRPLGIRSK